MPITTFVNDIFTAAAALLRGVGSEETETGLKTGSLDTAWLARLDRGKKKKSNLRSRGPMIDQAPGTCQPVLDCSGGPVPSNAGLGRCQRGRCPSKVGTTFHTHGARMNGHDTSWQCSSSLGCFKMHIGPQKAATSTVHLHWVFCPVPSNVSEWLSRPICPVGNGAGGGRRMSTRLNKQPFVS